MPPFPPPTVGPVPQFVLRFLPGSWVFPVQILPMPLPGKQPPPSTSRKRFPGPKHLCISPATRPAAAYILASGHPWHQSCFGVEEPWLVPPFPAPHLPPGKKPALLPYPTLSMRLAYQNPDCYGRNPQRPVRLSAHWG